MPVSLFEDVIDLSVAVVEPIFPTAASAPFPALRSTPRTETKRFSVVMLENAYLRLAIAPDLGGRIVSLIAKATGDDLLAPIDGWTCRQSGPRGLVLPGGLSFHAGRDRSRCEMGTVAVAVMEAAGDPSVAVEDTLGTAGLAARWSVSIEPEAAQIVWRVQVANTTSAPIDYRPRFEFGRSGIARGSGIALESGDALFCHGVQPRSAGDSLVLDRLPGRAWLGPHVVDAFECRIAVFPGVSEPRLWSLGAVVAVEEDRLRVGVAEPRLRAPMEVALRDGERFGATVDLYPERPTDLPFPGARARMDSVRVGGVELASASENEGYDHTEIVKWERPGKRALGEIDPRWRGVAALEVARAAVAERRWDDAREAYERALTYHGDDPALWWEKAVMERNANGVADGPELSNAHFLAPLEPALRAESFLALGVELPKEPHALIRPLADRPELFAHVTCRYLEAGFVQDAFRWLDEALRHVDAPLLRYLCAWTLLNESRMAVEAASHVAAARKLGDRPPYPSHRIERRAIEELADRFPTDPILAAWRAIKP